ncbi:hypothetical protein GQ55_9G376500 [Panicum hallii var. hallii]|uniref:Uncharacterized protein n=1 Tax=Panicum hallii var. hallii TaxID=1504633 RepID=A0A2T7C9C6_9POAL|nr:hypothetical protein GQ55_9G376500 [Panicum hallii var. hallii]
MSVTAIFTKGGNNGYEMQDYRMTVQINIVSQVSSIRVFLQHLEIWESSVHSDKDISTSALEQRFG